MNKLQPSKLGQICKIKSPSPNQNSEEELIVISNPQDIADDENVLVATLSDLQRHQKAPLQTPTKYVLKRDLVVIAEDLETYVASWNKKD